MSGGVEAVPGIERAKAMGLRVVVSDGNPAAPGFALADERVVASTYNVAETVRLAREVHARTPVHGVLSIAADVPRTVAAVSDALKLPGIPLESAELAADKLLMKDAFARRNVPIPWYSAVRDAAHLAELVEARGLPLVLKPVDSRGARGVLRLTGGVDLAWAYAHARSVSPTGRVMVEEFLAGPQISSESVVVRGRVHTVALADRNYELLDRHAPYIVENGGEVPSALDADAQDAIHRLVEQAARAMGIHDGIVKGDIVVTPDGPKVIEVAARLSGGWFSTVEIPLATGVDIVGAAIRLALGEAPTAEELHPRPLRHLAQRYFFPAPGLVRTVRGVDELAREPWVKLLRVYPRAGDVVPPITDHTRRAGVVIVEGATRKEALSRVAEAERRVRIVTEATSP